MNSSNCSATDHRDRKQEERAKEKEEEHDNETGASKVLCDPAARAQHRPGQERQLPTHDESPPTGARVGQRHARPKALSKHPTSHELLPLRHAVGHDQDGGRPREGAPAAAAPAAAAGPPPAAGKCRRACDHLGNTRSHHTHIHTLSLSISYQRAAAGEEPFTYLARTLDRLRTAILEQLPPQARASVELEARLGVFCHGAWRARDTVSPPPTSSRMHDAVWSGQIINRRGPRDRGRARLSPLRGGGGHRPRRQCVCGVCGMCVWVGVDSCRRKAHPLNHPLPRLPAPNQPGCQAPPPPPPPLGRRRASSPASRGAPSNRCGTPSHVRS